MSFNPTSHNSDLLRQISTLDPVDLSALRRFDDLADEDLAVELIDLYLDEGVRLLDCIREAIGKKGLAGRKVIFTQPTRKQQKSGCFAHSILLRQVRTGRLR